MKKPKGINMYLRELRVQSGITQLEAARSLGHQTAQYISNLERGLCEPSVEMAVVLTERYGGSRKKLENVMLRLYVKQLRARLNGAPGGSPLR